MQGASALTIQILASKFSSFFFAFISLHFDIIKTKMQKQKADAKESCPTRTYWSAFKYQSL
jgi:hypothetical protein